MGSNTKGALLSLLAFGVFATHDVVIKYLGANYAPVQIVFFSVLFGFPLVSFMLIGDSSAQNLRPRHPWWTALRTVSVLISGVCIFYAFSVLPLAQVYVMLFSMPLLITLLSVPILGEQVGLHRGGAVLAGLVGVLIVLQPGTTALTLAHFSALFGAFFGALASVIVRRIGRDERDLVLLMYPMLGNFVVMGAVLPLYYVPMPILDLGAVALMAVLAVVAMRLMIGAYKAGDAAVVAPMQYSQILWASLYGAWFFNESLEKFTWIGAAVIVASGLYIVIRESGHNPDGNMPVLRSRSRIAAGAYFRIGPLMRKARIRASKK
ncbi:membrane protein [Amylibacter marinus]|uniref:Membrane protein n=1 Tax=Amylibacter marinus TaxID=1475483 RepID=A0ABQ5VVM2_9RHOB|nr:DMT family transporter [Amylibacter marinus]GLQ35194.1 membrane protein [Amylibacter marinus]